MKQKREQPPPAIGGVNVAMITPRRPAQVEIDLGAMLEAIEFLGSSGVQSVTLFGSTGEFVHYTPEERCRSVALAVKRSRVPLLANVSHSTLDGAVLMAEEAAGSGVAAVVLMPPHFFRYQAESIEAFYLEFAGQVGKWTPIFLYNIPVFTNELPLATAGKLLATGLFAGIKDSSGDWDYLEALLRARPSGVFVGNDRLFTRGRRAGASGVVSGVACAIPELLVALDRVIQAGLPAERLEERLEEFVDWLDCFPTPVGIKEACAVRGLKAGPPATPVPEGMARRMENFRSWFKEWLPVVVKECRDAQV